jgi:hypothetical protein
VADLLPNHARLGEIDYPLVQARLRAWLVLEDFYSNVLRAAELGNREEFTSSLFSYVSAALSVSIETIKDLPWYEVTRIFGVIYDINLPSKKFPMMKKHVKKKHAAEAPGWDYLGRSWYVWLHLLSHEFGWCIEYIENMSIDDGIALLQETLVNDQLQKEWEWGMSQNAFSYDEITKTSKFIPLERPEWMQPSPKPVEKIRIRASQLPVGLILKWDTDTNEYTKSQ